MVSHGTVWEVDILTNMVSHGTVSEVDIFMNVVRHGIIESWYGRQHSASLHDKSIRKMLISNGKFLSPMI